MLTTEGDVDDAQVENQFIQLLLSIARVEVLGIPHANCVNQGEI